MKQTPIVMDFVPRKRTSNLTKDDIWGNDTTILVARSGDKCPVHGDVLGSKDVTAVCSEAEVDDVEHWLSYVQGGLSHDWTVLKDGRFAIRSEYLCW